MTRSIIDVTDDDIPPVLNSAVPQLKSMNTKLYVALLLALMVIIAQGFWMNAANTRAENNTELMFIKMYPNGSWDVEYRESGLESDFFPLTIDKLIMDYVEARFSVNPGSMRREYGFASLFMSEQLRGRFLGTSKGQLNARKIAEEKDTSSITEEVNIRVVDHFDVSEGVFVKGNADVYRTNVFIERISLDQRGMVIGKPVKEVVTLHWRIKSVEELKGLSRDDLRANPIGLQIMQEKIRLDISESE